jgi:hypothetical protein
MRETADPHSTSLRVNLYAQDDRDDKQAAEGAFLSAVGLGKSLSAVKLLEHIAGWFRKEVSKTEIRENYPSLSDLDLDLASASIHARMSPPPGRPRKASNLGVGRRHESRVTFLLDEHMSPTLYHAWQS